jgi:hypothetical protein
MTSLSSRQRAGTALGLALSALVGSGAPAFAGELHNASAAAHGGGSSSSTRSSSGPASSSEGGTSSFTGDDGSGDSALGNAVARALFEYVLLSPFSVPHVALESDDRPAGGWSLLSRPYENGASGYLARVAATPDASDDLAPDPRAIPPEARRDVAFQVGAEGMIPLQYVGRVQARARMMTTTRFDLDVAYARYFEQDPAGGATSAWSGQTHVTYRFAQSERAQFRAGLGLRHWADDLGSEFGLDFLYGIDIFWGKPVTTSLEATGGWVGSAWAFGARGTVGVVVGNGEVFAGYDATWMGPTASNGPTAYLGGPVAGVRAYF